MKGSAAWPALSLITSAPQGSRPPPLGARPRPPPHSRSAPLPGGRSDSDAGWVGSESCKFEAEIHPRRDLAFRPPPGTLQSRRPWPQTLSPPSPPLRTAPPEAEVPPIPDKTHNETIEMIQRHPEPGAEAVGARLLMVTVQFYTPGSFLEPEPDQGATKQGVKTKYCCLSEHKRRRRQA